MEGLARFLLMGGVIFCGSVVTIVYMGIQYSSRKRGLTKGASKRELVEIRQRLDALGEDIHAMQESMADMTLMLGDVARDRLTDRDS